ncbi:MAG: FAD-binding oxidoreductase [Candidatus Helarchaeota archaeon]
MSDEILTKLKKIFNNENVTNDPKILEQYKSDMSFGFIEPKLPKYVVYPINIKQVQQLVQLANEKSIALIPTSSDPPRFHGTCIPREDNTIIVNFTRMKKILNVDVKNRGIMLESGVNFEEFIAITKKNKLRPHLPLYPYAKKSVVGSALDREPVIIPKYHWDSADPLLCTELVFGTGNMFRTGAAAGPGNLTEQREAGGAQKNPMGPAQFSPYRIVQGSQGSIAMVTWATVKVQRAIDKRKIFFITSDSLGSDFDFIYQLLKFRLGDELLILNNLNFAILLEKDAPRIEKLRNKLPNWIGIISVTGIGSLAQDKIEWQEGDISEYAEKFGVELKTSIPNVSNDAVTTILEEASPVPWRLKFKGGCYDIFFISTLDQTPEYKKIMWNTANQQKFEETNIGVYIQPMVQGCNVHCEFDLYFNPADEKDLEITKNTFLKSSQALIDNGAFFSRPYGIWADMIYPKIQPGIVESMRKVKNIFDPNGVLNPGALCFKEGL